MNVVITQNSQTKRWHYAICAANGHAVARSVENYGLKRTALRAARALFEDCGKLTVSFVNDVRTQGWYWILRSKTERALAVSSDEYTRRANAARAANKLLSATFTLKDT